MNFGQIRMLIAARYPMVFILLVTFLATTLFAQEKRQVSKQEFALGIQLELSDQEIDESTRYLSVSDSNGRDLAILSARIGEKTLWVKRTADAATAAGNLHWIFDTENGILIVDLGAVYEDISEASPLQLVVAPLSARSREYRLSVSETETRPVTAAATKDQMIKEMIVEIN